MNRNGRKKGKQVPEQYWVSLLQIQMAQCAYIYIYIYIKTRIRSIRSSSFWGKKNMTIVKRIYQV
jgi:hypothetical protein